MLIEMLFILLLSFFLLHLCLKVAPSWARRKRTENVMQAVIVAAFALWTAWGARPDPSINMKKLAGMTPDQVIACLGPPQSDPRKPLHGFPPEWTPELEAKGPCTPLTFTYYDSFPYWQGYWHAIIFKNYRVVGITTGAK